MSLSKQVSFSNPVPKPQVKFNRHGTKPVVGTRVVGLVPLNHPNPFLNNEEVITSIVVSVADNGYDFETQNTSYEFSSD